MTLGKFEEPCRLTLLANAPSLYLDYDNCLHVCDAFKTADGIVPSNPSATFFEFAGVLESLLAPYPPLQIVLSTSWVRVIGFSAARDSLPLASLWTRVVGSTFNPEEDSVATWRSKNSATSGQPPCEKVGIKNWLALDDLRAGFEGVERHLVRCQQGGGLGDKDVQRLFASRLELMFGQPDSRSSGDSSIAECSA
ncbi:HAD domain-containing protein [Paraburkholderia sp. FT54]|uniref:HAD domain-containing protein n=1 Tax=Paraburkholderia sp. FT54 TaxID=3074437 RepID=UPI002877C32D|nr:HAD domain-containing protein [Paraburkholderia sp. FT54]WNC90207.1 HAD domain-containing protein [Paraburkholderia sp. FT54]